MAAQPAAAADPSPLIQAVKRHDGAAVNALLDRGTDVNAAHADGSTALHGPPPRRSSDGRAPARRGCRTRRRDPLQVRPLELASNNGNRAAVERLLTAGADPNAPSREGQTPLMTAALSGRVEAVEALLAHGAKSTRWRRIAAKRR